MKDYDGYQKWLNDLEYCDDRRMSETLKRFENHFCGYIHDYGMSFVKFVPANHPRELPHGCFPNMAYPVRISKTFNKYGDIRITVSVCDIDDGIYVGEYNTIEKALSIYNSINYGFTITDLIDLGLRS